MWDFELQCGHGEFAVENAECNCLHIIALFTLQCGHGEFAVENKRFTYVVLKRKEASMRPRRIRRGERGNSVPERLLCLCFNAATANSPWRTEIRPRSTIPSSRSASMRPRRIRRGEPR